MPTQRMTSRTDQGAPLLRLVGPRMAHPLRGLRPDLATLARKLEAEVDSLCARAAAHEAAGRDLEVRLNKLRCDVAQVAAGEERRS
jgi:hypothetical protein